MCIKRRKNPAKTAPAPTDVSSDGGITNPLNPGPQRTTRDERKPPVNSGSEKKVSASYRKFSSTTTGGSGSAIAKNKMEQAWTREDNNKASAEADLPNPMPLRSENQELVVGPQHPSPQIREPEVKERPERKKSASPEHQPPAPPQPQIEHHPEPKFDKVSCILLVFV